MESGVLRMTRFMKSCAVAALSLTLPLTMVSTGNALPATSSLALSAPAVAHAAAQDRD